MLWLNNNCGPVFYDLCNAEFNTEIGHHFNYNALIRMIPNLIYFSV